MTCPNYFGVACIDGACPLANQDEYVERGYDLIHSCEQCIYYKGCEDCGVPNCPNDTILKKRG